MNGFIFAFVAPLLLIVITTTSATNVNVNANANANNSILIEDFSDGPINKWTTMNDPVMGGKSKSSLVIENGVATFEGTCAIVPFLHAPGFITMVTGHSFNPFATKSVFPDVSTCDSITINIRSRTQYSGYYISFGTDRVPGGGHAMGYKSPLFNEEVPFGLDFVDIIIPFNEFSSNWDEGSGKTKISCKDNNIYCPTLSTLQNMKSMSFWGEGVEGDVALDIRYIGAIGCSTGSTNNDNDNDNASSDAAAVVAAADAAIITSGNVVQQRYQELSEGNQIFTLFCVISSMMALFSVVYMLFVSNKKQKSYVEVKSCEQNRMIDDDADTEINDDNITTTVVVV
ncbi:hypothetical protein FRACYDRAFT_238388 [Fragilariopsis cylindrus CCMP1102]|uniref:NADH:ubiquinone oxidoreductase intermediate-associated protein 30 domain-containing protein n=1 Tax=Fragilariopsis cylindrus CCMP1102 TaxID=635003 RepID=A0A1E7FIJ3_9STRA|nr:hypothetical protein FRACYDRAFT_238388 [Fragilariopsis cylindrus CCMP1102]|eukprot:OEU17957.1 hypothetical protein FRACYDRAFT_238388 [Fragilariopsis cylindrus CCMP1102]